MLCFLFVMAVFVWRGGVSTPFFLFFRADFFSSIFLLLDPGNFDMSTFKVQFLKYLCFLKIQGLRGILTLITHLLNYTL